MHDTLKRFHYPDDLIQDYKYWAMLIRDNQVTIGSLVLVAKPDVNSLGELSAEAWAEFGAVCKDAERILKKTFAVDKFNYLAFMMKDPHVHFHLLPRYSKPVSFNGRVFHDTDWPGASSMAKLSMQKSELELLQNTLKENI